MPELTDSYLREQLMARRRRLETTLASPVRQQGIEELLNEVDVALARMEAGTYGLCDVCHDTIERDRLLADPLVRLCLDHLSPEHRRLLEQDLELAAQLQQGLLPAAHQTFAGWTVAYHYRPLRLVSGDYCDLMVRANGRKELFFSLGDVSGKGVAASMLMAQLRAILRTLAASDLPVHSLVERAGRIFCETTMSTFFATLVCGQADASGGIELCNAGHCPALVFRDGEITRLPATGVPLGMFCEGRYTPQQVRLNAGETLVLYTDGVSEAQSPSGEEYGEAGLVEVLTRERDLPPEALIAACLDHLNAFRCGQPLHDDLTIMAIQRSS